MFSETSESPEEKKEEAIRAAEYEAKVKKIREDQDCFTKARTQYCGANSTIGSCICECFCFPCMCASGAEFKTVKYLSSLFSTPTPPAREQMDDPKSRGPGIR